MSKQVASDYIELSSRFSTSILDEFSADKTLLKETHQKCNGLVPVFDQYAMDWKQLSMKC